MNLTARWLIAISMWLTFGIGPSAVRAEESLPEGARKTGVPGMLLVPTAEAEELLRTKKILLPTCLQDLARAEVESTDAIRVHEALQAIDAERIKALQQQLEAARPAWYDSPLLWTGIGVIAGVALTYAVVELVQPPRP